jgi:hypothetical protein
MPGATNVRRNRAGEEDPMSTSISYPLTNLAASRTSDDRDINGNAKTGAAIVLLVMLGLCAVIADFDMATLPPESFLVAP